MKISTILIGTSRAIGFSHTLSNFNLLQVLSFFPSRSIKFLPRSCSLRSTVYRYTHYHILNSFMMKARRIVGRNGRCAKPPWQFSATATTATVMPCHRGHRSHNDRSSQLFCNSLLQAVMNLYLYATLIRHRSQTNLGHCYTKFSLASRSLKTGRNFALGAAKLFLLATLKIQGSAMWFASSRYNSSS